MRQAKQIEIPAKTQEGLDFIKCDLCGAATNRDDFDSKSGNWAKGSYNELLVAVYLQEGSNYPEGGHSKSLVFDICPDCFKGKIVPYLESLGAKPRKVENDW